MAHDKNSGHRACAVGLDATGPVSRSLASLPAGIRLPRPTPARHAAAALFIGAWALALDPAGAAAQGLEETACLAFTGAGDCRTVTVVDAGSCVVKVRPKPLPPLDPAIAGCLIDDIGTRLVFLTNARAEDTAVSADAGAADGTGARTTVRLAGPGVVRVLTGYDEDGAAVWEARDEGTFEHAGEAAQTRAALETLSAALCGPEAQTAGAAPRAIGVEEAYRLSSAGRIVLVDVRRESEWRETGIAATAVPITMNQRREDFVRRLRAEAAAAGETPLALICARGESSAYLQRALKAYGLDGIIDVTGGMLGGGGAPGWIPAGLPVKPWEGTER